MQIVLDQKYSAKSSVLALGMFDGVHIGHRVLLERAAHLAKKHGVPLVVCTFQQHPLQVIAPEKCPPMLSSAEERNQLMESLGVDVLCAMPFTREVMDMLPEEYVGQLVRRFHPVAVVCGYNHTFGRKGQGSPALLEALGEALGFETSIVPKITLGEQEVSSSAIRGLLSNGNVELARKLLARPYEHAATLVHREGSECLLQILREDKQTLPTGEYRAFLCDEEHAYPVLLHTQENGTARCMLPHHAPIGSTLCLQYWCNLSIDF